MSTTTTDSPSSLTLVSLNDITIASPCRMDWDLMDGDDCVRFCQKCSKNVYNLSAMNELEARELIQTSGDRICGRIFRRADGTVVTDKCPPLATNKLRGRFQFSVAALVMLMTEAAGVFAATPWIGKKVGPLIERFMAPQPAPLMGTVAAPPVYAEMGDIIVEMPSDEE